MRKLTNHPKILYNGDLELSNPEIYKLYPKDFEKD